jgi:tetratricopeptide (TPR) repeat protein
MADEDRAEEQLPEHEALLRIWEHVRQFVARYGLHILIAAGVAALAGTVYRIHVLRGQERVASQWQMLTAMPDATLAALTSDRAEAQKLIEQCRDMLGNQPRSSATPWIMLKMGNLEAFSGQWNEAANTYAWVVREYPGNPVAGVARMAEACALEQVGRYKDAAALYEKAAQGGPLRALYDAGRCLELSGDLEGARKEYELFLKEKEVTGELRAVVESRLAELASGKPLAAPPQIKPLEPAKLPPEQEPSPAQPPEAAPGGEPAAAGGGSK